MIKPEEMTPEEYKQYRHKIGCELYYLLDQQICLHSDPKYADHKKLYDDIRQDQFIHGIKYR